MDELPAHRAPDPWVFYSRMTLIFTGVCYLLLGGVMGMFMPAIMKLDQQPGDQEIPETFNLVFGVIMFVMCAGFAFLNFVAAWGLGRQAKWAWFMAVILGGLYAPSACLPFGVVLLYGMLNDRTRKSFLG